MKKKIILAGIALVAISLGIVGISAFESHVINVTAQIENALSVPIETTGMSFGTVFPEEVFYKNFDIALSGSFLTTQRVDDVEYMIRQKPKCGVPILGTDPTQYSSHPQVTENSVGEFVCPMAKNPVGEDVQSVMLPLLCPFLSKHELDPTGKPLEGGIDAFHGPLINWDMQDTIDTQLEGRLSKADQKTSATWQIDLHAPCFKGMCAQDNVIPAGYEADPKFEHQIFGCDLWVEVTGISLPTGPTLTVIKHVINDDQTQDNIASDFTMHVSGTNVSSPTFPGAESPGTTVTLDVGSYSVSEDPIAGYTSSASADCSGSILAGEHKTCTITNDDNVPDLATLTVIKHVVNTGGGTHSASEFTMTVTGTSPSPASFAGAESPGTDVTLAPGSYSVDETGPSGYTKSLGTDCSGTIAAGEHKTCTITNTFETATLTVIKHIINTGGGTKSASDFTMTVTGTSPSPASFAGAESPGTDVTLAPGSYSVDETGPSGYSKGLGTDCSGTIAAGEHKTCTVTNTYEYVTITVNKLVSNPHGGNDAASTFSLFVHNGTANIPVSDGVPQIFAAGSFDVNEGPHTGYNGSVTAGDCDPSGHMSASSGSLTCTITNTETQPVITVLKSVFNGTTPPSAFILRVDGSILFASSKNVNSNTPHTITEDDPSSLGYKFKSLTGTGSRGTFCPTNLGDTFSLKSGETIVCTITNELIQP